MRCFYHPQAVAVGLCKNCGKGLCPECAVDVQHGLACKNKCEIKVEALTEVGHQKMGVFQKQVSLIRLGTLCIAVFGLVFFLLTVSKMSEGPWSYKSWGWLFPMALGATCFVLGFLCFLRPDFDRSSYISRAGPQEIHRVTRPLSAEVLVHG